MSLKLYKEKPYSVYLSHLDEGKIVHIHLYTWVIHLYQLENVSGRGNLILVPLQVSRCNLVNCSEERKTAIILLT